MNRVTNSGMYVLALGPPSDRAKPCRPSYSASMAFWADPGMASRLRVSKMSVTIMSTEMIHIVKIVFVMLTSQTTRASEAA